MPKQNNELLTKLEQNNPLGKIVTEGSSSETIVKKLKEVDFLTDDLKLTERGTAFVKGKLEKMDSVERIMIELFILEHHQVDTNVEFDE